MATKKIQGYLEEDIAVLFAEWKSDKDLSDSAAINVILREYFGTAAPGAGGAEEDIKALVQQEMQPLREEVASLTEKLRELRYELYERLPETKPYEYESESDSMHDSFIEDSIFESKSNSLGDSPSSIPTESYHDSQNESLSRRPLADPRLAICLDISSDSLPELSPESLPDSSPESLPESSSDSLPDSPSDSPSDSPKKRTPKKGDRVVEPITGRGGEIISVRRANPKYAIDWDGGMIEEYSQKEFNRAIEFEPPQEPEQYTYLMSELSY